MSHRLFLHSRNKTPRNYENQTDTKSRASAKVKTWSKTRHIDHWRHRRDHYYIRASVGGKQKWRERMLKSTPYVPSNAKTAMRNSTRCSRTTKTSSVAVLRSASDIALASGAIHSNPAREIHSKISRRTIRPRKRTALSSSEPFLTFVMKIDFPRLSTNCKKTSQEDLITSPSSSSSYTFTFFRRNQAPVLQVKETKSCEVASGTTVVTPSLTRRERFLGGHPPSGKSQTLMRFDLKEMLICLVNPLPAPTPILLFSPFATLVFAGLQSLFGPKLCGRASM